MLPTKRKHVSYREATVSVRIEKIMSEVASSKLADK
jgi:hypothetical protein